MRIYMYVFIQIIIYYIIYKYRCFSQTWSCLKTIRSMHVQPAISCKVKFFPLIKNAPRFEPFPKIGLPIQTFLISSDFRNFLFVELMEHMQKSGNGQFEWRKAFYHEGGNSKTWRYFHNDGPGFFFLEGNSILGWDLTRDRLSGKQTILR